MCTVNIQVLLMGNIQTLYYWICVYFSQKEDILLDFFVKLNLEVWILLDGITLSILTVTPSQCLLWFTAQAHISNTVKITQNVKKWTGLDDTTWPTNGSAVSRAFTEQIKWVMYLEKTQHIGLFCICKEEEDLSLFLNKFYPSSVGARRT